MSSVIGSKKFLIEDKEISLYHCMMPNIEKLLNELTLEEKILLLSGFDAWHTNKVERLAIPSIKMSDGPNGIRGNGNSGEPSACFPSAISLGSSWNMSLINRLGIELGEEAKAKDVDVLLGPTINIHRHPLGGRHFESFSEDPYLTGRIAIEYVNGVQSKNVAACLKHFVGNDTEYERYSVSSNIDEKTLREIYLLPFEMAIKEANAKVVMSAYNKLNNIYCSSHRNLLINILKEEWDFDGYVVSDWGAALETVENANGGLDLEMPGPAKNWGKLLKDEVDNSNVSTQEINNKVRRILHVAAFTRRFDHPEIKPESSNDNKAQRILLREAAQEGMVLLKNEKLLPLDSNLQSIGIIGPNAKNAQIIGGGSAHLQSYYESHPLEALKSKIGDSVNIKYSKGCHTYKYLPIFNENLIEADSSKKNKFLVEYFNTANGGEKLISQEYELRSKFWALEGFAKDIIAKEERPDIFVKFSCTYTPDVTGIHEFEIFAIGKSKLLIDGKEIIDNWSNTEPGDAFFALGTASKKGTANLENAKKYQIEIQYKFEGNFPAIYIGCKAPDKVDLFNEALQIAKEVDQVIMVVGTNSDWETEGNDRADFNLPSRQNELIDAVIDINPNTILVLNTGSPIKMPWIHKVKSVIQTWYAGQEFGNALANIITGDISPSGKLPSTFPINIEDTPAFSSYPGKDLQMNYDEKLLVGYKWYDKKNIKTQYPFGHGLSYTKFKYSNLAIDKLKDNLISCKFTIKNTGDFSGAEISQCYVEHIIDTKSKPVKKLQGFDKTFLSPQEEKEIEIILNAKSFSEWSLDKKDWEIKKGFYKIHIGASSEDIRLSKQFNL